MNSDKTRLWAALPLPGTPRAPLASFRVSFLMCMVTSRVVEMVGSSG